MKLKLVNTDLTVRAVDPDKREIIGIATTPGIDQMGDIVEPRGAVFRLPIPLLWQHDRERPIGQVTHAKVTSAGIEIRAKIPTVAEEGKLRERLDEAWQSLKVGLVRGLSIGFSPIESTPLRGGGFRILKWAWHELSACTIPANSEAAIQTVRKLDRHPGAVYVGSPYRDHRLPGVVYLDEPVGSMRQPHKVVYL